ncbi:MAG: glucose 1-dehydrogenase [Thermodesulfobacteriota bacterium]|nr:glucose 1-dehydrogenase [Thermodesulfobacteriota bacterium]
MIEIFSLQGKKAFVSGASRGLGREMALTLAEAGADVALGARNIAGLNETAAQIKKMGREGLVCPMDIAKLDEIERAVDEAVKAFGRIDILINNSGIAGDTPVAEMTPEKWDRVMDVNLKGHVFCTQAVGRHMIANRYGKIINIASIIGMIAAVYNSPYAVAKAGLILFTKTLALEWVRYNIQVNALCPGYFLTDLNRDFFQTPAGQKVISKIPMRRLAEVKEIRGATLLLASDASSFMTGSVVVVDGGHTIG